MSKSTLICEIGFEYSDDPEYLYYHVEGDERLGYEFSIEQGDELLDPYNLHDLVAGTIPYPHLPEAIKDLIHSLAERAYRAISIVNPLEAQKLDPKAFEVVFHRKNNGAPSKVMLH